VPIQAFVDESGGIGQSRHFVMAGLIGHSEDWAVFSDEWRACLDAPPRISAFKMKDAASCSGQFYGFSEGQRDAKLTSLAKVINRHALYCSHSAIDLEAHAGLWASLPKPQCEPYFWPFHNTVMATCFELWDRGWRERFEIIFDEQVIFGPRAKAWYPAIRETVTMQNPDEGSIMPVDPVFRTDDEFLPLQAADLFAWCWRKGTDIGPEGERPFEWLLPYLSNVFLTPHSQYYDRERMQSVLKLSEKAAEELRAGLNPANAELARKYRHLWGR
jgi:hypothetical protein